MRKTFALYCYHIYINRYISRTYVPNKNKLFKCLKGQKKAKSFEVFVIKSIGNAVGQLSI